MEGNESASISLPGGFPLSDFNANFDGSDRPQAIEHMKVIYWALFYKYIAESSHLVINLNDRLREKMTQCIENLSLQPEATSVVEDEEAILKEIVRLFEKAFVEVAGILDGAFDRFKQSELGNECISRLNANAMSITTSITDMMFSVVDVAIPNVSS